MPPKQNKNKESAPTVQLLPASLTCALPLWDDTQILQENWGASLSAASVTASNAAASAVSASGKEAGKGKGAAKEGQSAGAFVDPEGRALIAKVLDSDSKEGVQRPARALSMDSQIALPGDAPKSRFTWQRPADVVRPFRPVVHRNTTPFLHPYAADSERAVSCLEEASAEPKSVAPAAKTAGRKSEAHKEVEPELPHYEEYPETITLLHDLVGQGTVSWEAMPQREAIERYRAMAPLMQPYNPTLTASCAETPAEAIGSRYSTALRHKLKAAEALEALEAIPPFFMSGFNSVLLLVHQSQYLVREGHYLWELVYPHAPGTCHPVYNPYGKYAVKLFVDGAYRKVVVDDALPVDELDRPLLTVTSRKELWPALLAKAIVKVCGQAAKDMLLRSPEVIISMLLGNWVPRYVTARKDSVDTAALCLEYARQLAAPPLPPMPDRSASHTTTGMAGGRGSTQKDTGSGRRSKSSASRPSSSNSAPGSAHGGKAAKASGSRPSSSARRSQTPQPPVDSGDGLLVPVSGDGSAAMLHGEIPPAAPMILCGLRQTPAEAQVTHPGVGNGVQIYSIARIVPFRHTLALAVQTTPHTDLAEGLFARERDRPDVHQVVHGHTDAGTTAMDKPEARTMCWLTLEEFCAAMETLLVWSGLDAQYVNQLFVETAGTGAASEAHNATSAAAATGKKSQAVVAAAAGPPVSGDPKSGGEGPEVVRWVKITCTAPTDILLVASRSLAPNVPGGGAEHAAANAGDRRPSQQSPQPALDDNHNVAHADEAPLVGAPHEMELSYYVWDRCDPLTTALRPVYYTGKVSSTVFSLGAGVHVYRLRVPATSPSDRIVFFSNAEMEMLPESPEHGKSSVFSILTDADRRVAVQKPDEEYLWLKRKFRVAEPTRLTLLLETLPLTEDLARHRLLPNAPGKPTGKSAGAGKAGGGGGGGSSGAGAGGSSTASSATPSTTNRRSSISTSAVPGPMVERMADHPILRYTKLMLVNLDNRQELVFGESGRLPQLLLQPNTKGYYVTAFTRVPVSDVPAAARPAEVASAPLFHPGQWKLVARSDHELQNFEALPLAAHTVSTNGSLARGGSPLLFRYTCLVTENTHVTVAADIQTRVPGCQFELRLTRASRPATPGTMPAGPTNSISTSGPLAPVSPSARGKSHSSARPPTADCVPGKEEDDCVYESGWHATHLFLPEFLLEPADKSKPATYLIEGRVPPQFAAAWDERCRHAQEQRFLTWREAAVLKAQARYDEERQLAVDDPASFVQRKQEEQASEQQLMQQFALEQTEKATKDGRSRKKRPSIQGGIVTSSSGSAPPHRLTDSSFSAEADGVIQQLDMVDGDLDVHYHVFIDLSSAKAECKATPQLSSGLTTLRQQWAGLTQFIHNVRTPTAATDGSATAGTTTTTPPSSSRGAGSSSARSASSRGHQKDSLATSSDEVAQRALVAATQRARQQFLTNPANLLFPHVEEPAEKEATAGKKEKSTSNATRLNVSADAHGASTTTATTTNATIVVEDTEEDNFRYAPHLSPAEYTVRWLPLWAAEACEPTTVADSAASEKPPSTGSGKRAKPGKEPRLSAATSASSAGGAGNNGAIASGSGASPTAVAATGPALVQARIREEQELAFSAARSPLSRQTTVAVDAYKDNRERQQKQRKMAKELVYAFWRDHAYATTTASRVSTGTSPSVSSPSIDMLHALPDGTTSANTVHYTSLLGRSKEESDASALGRRQRSIPPA